VKILAKQIKNVFFTMSSMEQQQIKGMLLL